MQLHLKAAKGCETLVMLPSLVCLTLFCQFVVTFASFHPETVHLNDQKLIHQWLGAFREFARISGQNSSLFYHLLDTYETSNVNVTRDCARSFSFVSDGIRRKRDSTKLATVNHRLTNFEFGYISEVIDRFQCVDLTVSETSAQYCLLEVKLPTRPYQINEQLKIYRLNVTGTELEATQFEIYAEYFDYFINRGLHIDLCIPSSCTADDLDTLLQKSLYSRSEFR